MTPEAFEKLKEKIEDAKTERDQARGAMKQIETMWKEDYSCSTVKEVKEKIASLEKQKITLEGKRDKLMAEIEDQLEKMDAVS